MAYNASHEPAASAARKTRWGSAALTCLVAWSLLGGTRLASAEDAQQENPASADADGRIVANDEAESILESMWASREELHSGVCHVDWSETIGDKTRSARCDLYFDYDQGLARVDRTTSAGRSVQRIDTPKELIVHVAGSRVVSRKAPFSPTVADGDPFDPRMVGIMELGEYLRSKRLSEVRDYLRTLATTEVVEQDGARRKYRITQQSVGPLMNEGEPVKNEGEPLVVTYRRITWIDGDLRFSPTRMEAWVGIGKNAGDRVELQCRSETTWDIRNDAAVPLKCSFSEEINPCSAEMVFLWEAVNEAVQDDVFTAEALVSERPSLIVNHRLGPAVIERKIDAESAALPPVPPPSWIWWAVGINGPAFVIAMIVWLFRYRAARQRK